MENCEIKTLPGVIVLPNINIVESGFGGFIWSLSDTIRISSIETVESDTLSLEGIFMLLWNNKLIDKFHFFLNKHANFGSYLFVGYFA